MNSIETTGKTVEEALGAALKALDCDSSEVNIEILDMGRSGFLGIGRREAKVRVTKNASFENEADKAVASIGRDTNKAKQERPVAKPVKPQKAAEAGVPKKAERTPRQQPSGEGKAVVKEREIKGSNAERPKQASAKPVAQAKPQRDAKPVIPPPEVPEEVQDPETLSELARVAYDFLENVTKLMGVDVTIRIGESEGQMAIKMNGDTLGILIGRRGETLDALQYLVSLKVNHGREEYVRVSLDTENYRAKREASLIKLANRMAQRAKKTGRRVVLEPMNPYERRVLHSALQGHADVTTHSEGHEPYRRVVITLKQQRK